MKVGSQMDSFEKVEEEKYFIKKYTIFSFINKNKNVLKKWQLELTLNGQILINSGEISIFCTDQNTKLYKDNQWNLLHLNVISKTPSYSKLRHST